MTRWLSGQIRFVLLAFVLLGLAGSAAAFRLPVSLFPRIDFPRVVVAIDAGDRPVEQNGQSGHTSGRTRAQNGSRRRFGSIHEQSGLRRTVGELRLGRGHGRRHPSGGIGGQRRRP